MDASPSSLLAANPLQGDGIRPQARDAVSLLAANPLQGDGIRPQARTALSEIAGRVRPVTLASDATLAVPGALGELLPGGLQRGVVVSVEGLTGAGITSVGFQLLAAATTVGEWAAAVELSRRGPTGPPRLGAVAASEWDVRLDHLAVVRDVEFRQWANVVAALVEGVSMVMTPPPSGLRVADARRVVARVRERRCVLVTLGRWPEGAGVRLHVEGSSWGGGPGERDQVDQRTMHVEIERRGGARRQGVVRSTSALARESLVGELAAG